MDAVTQRKLLGLLGLGVRGRLAVVGVERVREAVFKGKLALVVVAPDASRNSLDKVVPLLRARHVRYVEGPSASALGAAVGRDSTAAIGVVDKQLARGIRALVDAQPDGARASGSDGAQ